MRHAVEGGQVVRYDAGDVRHVVSLVVRVEHVSVGRDRAEAPGLDARREVGKVGELLAVKIR